MTRLFSVCRTKGTLGAHGSHKRARGRGTVAEFSRAFERMTKEKIHTRRQSAAAAAVSCDAGRSPVFIHDFVRATPTSLALPSPTSAHHPRRGRRLSVPPARPPLSATQRHLLPRYGCQSFAPPLLTLRGYSSATVR